jgi:hypothetical protein
MHYFEAILRVLFVGLVLGAGLPGVFAIGLRAYSAGLGGVGADGVVQRANPALKFLGLALFTVVGLVIVVAILWITRTTINHHFGVNLFPFLPKK